MFADLVHLTRSLRRSPASAAAAIVTLTVTIGAGASIFAVVDAFLLTPPPFANPDALAMLGEMPLDQPGDTPRAVTYGTFQAWRDRAASFAAIEAFDGTNMTLTGLGAAVRVSGTDVTPGFLQLLGVTPALGRTFDENDAAKPVAIVSDGFWRRRLAADPDVIGRPIVLGGQPHTIIGVLPERFVNASEVWRPIGLTPAQAARTGYRVRGLARISGNTDPQELERALGDVSRASSPPSRAVATRIATAIAGRSATALGLLAAAAAIAAIIAFTNLAGLLIVRAVDRRRELAVRAALGARRWTIARQLLLEGQLLVAAGTAGGLLLASWLTPAVGRLALEQFGGAANRDIAVSWRVIAVVVVLASLCALACGLVPALAATRRSVVDVLRRGTTAAPSELALRRVFVTCVIALAFVLLVSVALVGRSLFGVLSVSPGFDPGGVMLTNVSLPPGSYPTNERVAAFYSTLDGALRERFGPGAAAIVDEIPLMGNRGRTVVRARPSEAGRESVLRSAGTSYFDVMRIPVVSGRGFDARDDRAAPARVVLSASLAERLFGSTQAVGRRVWIGAPAQAADIIGIVGDVKHGGLDDASAPSVYVSAWQAPSRSSHIVVRSARPDADIIAMIAAEIARLDPDLPAYGARTMNSVLASSPGVPVRRVLTMTFTGFALLAVVLAAIGLFGVVAHDVSSRRSELALRVALGADPMRILRATLRQGLVLIGAGLAIGGVLSLWTARSLRGLLYGIGAFDAASIAAASAILVIVGLSAILPAARRAASTDPLIALRSE
jgi:putative ABC transport system permease protein